MDIQKLEESFSSFLENLGLDWKQDPNMVDTPKRVSKMFAQELFSGLYTDKPEITIFPNSEGYDQLIVSSWDISSMCSHHFLPFYGKIIIGILPGEYLLGLSKYARVVEWYAKRPQLQENITQQISKELIELLKPRGLGVYMKAHHMCSSLRGVKQPEGSMTTSSVYGAVKNDLSLKQEFMVHWK